MAQVGLTSNGTLRWEPPTDWVMAATHDGSGKTYGGTGPYFGQARLRDGGVAYVLRISWLVDSASTSTSVAPTLIDARLRRWVAPTADSTKCPSCASRGGTAPTMSTATATFRMPIVLSRQSVVHRAIPLRVSRALPWGRMWSPASSWCRIEPSNERLTMWLAEHLNQTWDAQGMGGAYNDDLLKLMGPAE